MKDMMISIVIPTYNRLENLKRCIAALLEQKATTIDYEIIVVDDGSTDQTREWLGEIQSVVRTLSGGPNKGFRGGRARNIGAFNAKGDLLVFVDTDVILNRHAIEAYWTLHRELPDAILAGPYHWVKPAWSHPQDYDILMASTEEERTYEQALLYLAHQHVDLLPDEFSGPDHRLRGHVNDLSYGDERKLLKNWGLGSLSGNIAYPKELFWALGGFDERITGHGGEDADLGLTAQKSDATWLFHARMTGLHLWHDRDQERNSRELTVNIQFIDAKHGVGTHKEAVRLNQGDWADPVQYHKHLGSSLIKVVNSPTVAAIRDGHGIRLREAPQVRQLGFEWNDMEHVSQDFWDGIAMTDWPADEEKVKARAPATFDEMKLTSYKKSENAVLIRPTSEQTVYAVRDNWRLAISHPDWIQWLGFAFDDIRVLPDHAFTGIDVAMVTPDPIVIVLGDPANA